MATFRNDTGDDLSIDRFGLYVPAGLTFEIPDEDADSLAGQPALVRIASDAEPDVTLPVEVLRDLTDQAAEPVSAPAVSDPAAPVSQDVPGTPTDGPIATADVPIANAGAEPVETAGAEPTTDAAHEGDVDSFTQL